MSWRTPQMLYKHSCSCRSNCVTFFFFFRRIRRDLCARDQNCKIKKRTADSGQGTADRGQGRVGALQKYKNNEKQWRQHKAYTQCHNQEPLSLAVVALLAFYHCAIHFHFVCVAGCHYLALIAACMPPRPTARRVSPCLDVVALVRVLIKIRHTPRATEKAFS